ncbi:MAG: G5 domain-containing protein [Clostridiales bacterium]|nr:MAG: G5 domain-containing protein [Clostridiales bacterium]
MLGGRYFEPVKLRRLNMKPTKTKLHTTPSASKTASFTRATPPLRSRAKNGKEVVKRKIEKINGSIKSNSEISKTVEKAPTNEVLMVGTKEKPSGVGTGSFAVPYNGNITSRYGQRSMGNHKGVDIVGPYRFADLRVGRRCGDVCRF